MLFLASPLCESTLKLHNDQLGREALLRGVLFINNMLIIIINNFIIIKELSIILIIIIITL